MRKFIDVIVVLLALGGLGHAALDALVSRLPAGLHHDWRGWGEVASYELGYLIPTLAELPPL